jgi:putative aldouronate transport system permease protein
MNNGGFILGTLPTVKGRNVRQRIYKYKAFYLMFLPVFVFYVLFHYWPMAGIRIAFFDYGLFGIKEFIGIDNFKTIFSDPLFFRAFRNTVVISMLKLITGTLAAIVFALLLNEIHTGLFKRFTQTVVYLPHFLSWPVVAALFALFLSPDGGIVNQLLVKLGGKSVYFLISTQWWQPVFIVVNLWKETGWGAIIYLASLTGIDPQLYEAAALDGAGRLKQIRYITLPGLLNTILVVFILNLSKVLNIFQPIFCMYNSQVYAVADVIGTYTYRMAFANPGGSDIDLAIAIGMFKSVVAMGLILISNYLTKKVKGEGIF